MKLKARDPREFAQEIHAAKVHNEVTSFDELEKLTEKWIVDYTEKVYQAGIAAGALQTSIELEKRIDKLTEPIINQSKA